MGNRYPSAQPQITQGESGMVEEASVVAREELEQPESGEKEHRRELHLFIQ